MALGAFTLRLHRKGYRTDAQLAAELDWMAWLDGSGLSVPAPVSSLAGPHLRHIGDNPDQCADLDQRRYVRQGISVAGHGSMM